MGKDHIRSQNVIHFFCNLLIISLISHSKRYCIWNFKNSCGIVSPDLVSSWWPWNMEAKVIPYRVGRMWSVFPASSFSKSSSSHVSLVWHLHIPFLHPTPYICHILGLLVLLTRLMLLCQLLLGAPTIGWSWDNHETHIQLQPVSILDWFKGEG